MSLIKKTILSLSMVAGLAACQSQGDLDVEGAVKSSSDTVTSELKAIEAKAVEAKDSAVSALKGTDPVSLEEAEKTIRSKLGPVFAQSAANILNVKKAGVDGLYQVELDGLRFIYTTADASHMIAGDLYEVATQGLENLSDVERSGSRAKLLAEIPEKDMIVFAPKGETKATVTVFTDVDCYYCQKLHADVPKMNEMGIKVRYLAFPRAGIGSPSYQKIASAWCADDKQDSMTKLKARQEIPMNVCKDNPVESHYILGQKVGVNGTPALLLDDGQLLPGYLPPARMAQALGL